MVYDLCIVGAGLIGSSAARHASNLPYVKVCVIGPEEPQDRRLDDSRSIFGAYYDEGRITRQCDPDPVWSELAKRSIERYRALEKESGVQFYAEVGCLSAGDANSEFMTRMNTTTTIQNIDVKRYEGKTLQEAFPYLNFHPSDNAIFEHKDAGHISPRNLLKAQLSVAVKNGCDVINDVVCNIQRLQDRDGGYIMEVKTEKGRTITARKVLLATGAYTTFRNILPPYVIPDQILCPLTVTKVEVSQDNADRLRWMPSILYSGPGANDWCKDFPKGKNNDFGFYFLPPIKYPNGKYYLKLGCFHENTTDRLDTLEQIKDVFCAQGDQQQVKHIASLIANIVKGIDAKSFHGDRCVITETPHARPYIDMVHGQMGVALGGNGFAAKSCDEIGRIAALMVLKDLWDTNIPRENLMLKLKLPIAKL